MLPLVFSVELCGSVVCGMVSSTPTGLVQLMGNAVVGDIPLVRTKSRDFGSQFQRILVDRWLGVGG